MRLVPEGLSAAEESLGCSHIAGGAQHRIDQVAVPVNGAIEITPRSFYFHVGFVHIPAPTDFPLAFATDVLGQQRSEPFLPLPHGFMRELESTQ